MFATAVVSSRQLKYCLECISLVAAKGSQVTPVGLVMEATEIVFDCLQGCIAQSKLEATIEGKAYTVFMYYDVTELIPTNEEVMLECNEYEVSMTGSSFSCKFPLGYSSFILHEFGKCKFSPVESKDYLSGLRTLIGMGLDKLYGQAKPIEVHGNVSIIKQACCYVQVRTLGLPFVAEIDAEHVKMISKFQPKEVSTSIADTLVFRKDNLYLQVPCRVDLEKNSIPELVGDLESKCRLTLGDACDRLREVSKISSKSKCQITGTPTGLTLTISVEGASSSINVGNTDGDLQFIYNFPIQVILSFFKALGSGEIEILTGGSLVCLRSQSLIILVRADY